MNLGESCKTMSRKYLKRIVLCGLILCGTCIYVLYHLIHKGLLQPSQVLLSDEPNVQSPCPLSVIKLPQEVACKVQQPSKEDCPLIHKLFFSKLKESCVGLITEICDFVGDQGSHNVQCDLSSVQDVNAISVDYMDRVSGRMITKKPTQDAVDNNINRRLELAISRIAALPSHSGFMLIRYKRHRDNGYEDITQMLLIPTSMYLSPRPPEHIPTDGFININLMFIDSVSYHHFKRSLPQTAHILDDLKSVHKVLEYPLFQAMKSRTFENLEALFAGTFNTSQTFGIQSMPLHPLPINALFKPLVQKGYETMFMEDLCWSWEWGLSKDLLIHNKNLKQNSYWSRFSTALNQSFIKHYGISPFSCEVYKKLGRPDPFHGLTSVCWSEKHMHEYFLQHLTDFQATFQQAGAPYASFLMSNIGHDDWGTRIRTFDTAFTSYLSTLSAQQNTLTVLLSDHGNAYGEFVGTSKLGKREIYHPFLYMILPKQVQQILGQGIVSKLMANQNRLLSMLDIYPLLNHIATGKTHVSGILSDLPAARSCQDMPLYQPNLCICDDITIGDSVSPSQLREVAEFASGTINSMLEAEFWQHNQKKKKVWGWTRNLCHILLPLRIGQPQYSKLKVNTLVVNMELYFSQINKPGKVEIVLVSVSINIRNNKYTRMQPLSTERITPYAPYEKLKCNNNVNIQLCICDKPGEGDDLFYFANNWLTEQLPANDVVKQTIANVTGECLISVTRIIDPTTFSMYIGNQCTDKHVDYSITIMKGAPIETYSGKLPAEGILRQSQIQFITTATHSDPTGFTTVNVMFDITERKIVPVV